MVSSILEMQTGFKTFVKLNLYFTDHYYFNDINKPDNNIVFIFII